MKTLALSVSDRQSGPTHKSLKRLRDDNDKAQHLTPLSRKARKVRLSDSDTPQDSQPISLERVEDQNSLVTCLEDSRIDLRPSGSSNSALFASLNASHGPLKTCEAALRAISDKLGLVTEASKTRRMLVWPFKANAVQKILQVIQKQKSNLILALASDEARAVSQMEDSLETNAEALLQINDTLAQNMEMMTEVRDVVQNKIERKKWEKMKQWLQSTDPGPNHRAAHEAHEPLTGNWLLESPDYCAWRADSGALLWLNGISGCGKTVLSATVVEDVRRFCSTNQTTAMRTITLTSTMQQKGSLTQWSARCSERSAVVWSLDLNAYGICTRSTSVGSRNLALTILSMRWCQYCRAIAKPTSSWMLSTNVRSKIDCSSAYAQLSQRVKT